MFPRVDRLGSLFLALSAVVLALAAPGEGRAGEVDTILRRPADAAEGLAAGGPLAGPGPLGPTRLQGDFDRALDALAAATGSGATIAGEAADSAAADVAPQAAAAPAGERQPALVAPVAGGIVGGTIGFYGGIVAGLAIANDEDGDEWDDLAAAITGAFVGEILVLPLGVHLGNARLGSYASDLGISFVSGLAGLAIFSLLGYEVPGLILGASLQLGSVVWTERRKARARIAERAGAP